MRKTKLFGLALLTAAWFGSGSAFAQDEPSKDADGFYLLYTAEDVEWFSNQVNVEGKLTLNGKLMQDIDFEGGTHTPIGKDNDHKWRGVFDGNSHRIKNMVIGSKESPYAADGCGFFGHVRAGAEDCLIVTIKNLIIDESCKIYSGKGNAAGIVGRIKDVQSNHQVTFENCGNEATINGGAGCAGILGGINASTVRITFKGCWNIGNITGTSESAAICGWTGKANDDKVKIEDCWNSGTIFGMDSNKNLYRSAGSSISTSNLYDASYTRHRTQGTLLPKSAVSNGTLCYMMNGDQTVIKWGQDLSNEDTYPIPYDNVHQVYCSEYKCPLSYVCTNSETTPSGSVNEAKHNINADKGMCDVCYTQFEEPAKDGDYYLLKNAGNVEWFSDQVAAGNLTINGKLMNDIDFYSIENLHNPIGPTTGQKYNGTFDGRGFRIKNMIIERPTENNIGFFGFLRGNNANTTVKNLIMDKSCKIHGYNRVGGITGSCQNSGTLITLENIINEATVIAEHQDAAGIIGGQEGNGPKWLIRNVLNLGTVTAKNEHPYAGALCCYLGGNGESVIENFVNLGTINGHEGGNIGRIAGKYTNIIDLSDTNPEGSTASGNIGFDTGLIKADIAGGKLAYTVGWWQELGVDDYPTPFEKDGAVVYRTGEERCDHADNAGTVYSNTDAPIVTGSHEYNASTGFCDLCSLPNADFKSLVDGAYELNDVNDVKWFAAMVNNGNPAINGKLTTDLDFKDGSCRIGNDAYPYCGIFQGGDHVVSNFVIDNSESFQGFFGYVTGGADISGLVLDNTCSITCLARGGIIGGAKTGGTVKLTRLGNEGKVTTTNENAAGIIGTDLNSACDLLIDQCYSTGAIKGGKESAQIAGWTGEFSKITNSWSSATVEGPQTGREFSRYKGDNHDAQYENCFTTYHETNGGLTYDTPAEDFASGKVAYATGFGQNLGTDATPSFSAPEVFYVGEAGYATLYDTTTGYELNGDVKAYVATLNPNYTNLILTEIENVPASTPVILKGTYYNKFAQDVPEINITNELQGTTVDTEADGTMYVLAKPEGKEVGFYLAEENTVIPAGKAYYKAATPGVKAFFFSGEDATAIDNVNANVNDNNAAIYNIAGQRINKLQKGINIVNGKKVLF